MIELTGMKELSIGGVKLRELSVGGVKVWQAGRLPAGYTEVEWIESTGIQYINTEVRARNYTDGITYDFTGVITSHTEHAYLMGALDNGTRSGNVTISTDGRLVMACGGNNNTLYYCYFTDGEMLNIHLEDVSAANLTAMACYTNDAEWSEGVGGGVASTVPGNNIHFLKCNNSARTGASCRIYSFIMTDASTDIKIRELIPCINPNGEVGMYDLVSDEFYANAGTGAFTAGPKV